MSAISSSKYVMILLGFLVLWSACSKDKENNSDLPRNLQVTVTVLQEGKGNVLIQATGENIVEYELWIGDAANPVETNQSGTFEYTFFQPGVYTIILRAYGKTGRFLSQDVLVSISIASDPVSPEDGYSTPLYYEGYELVWHDEFQGNTINPDYWVFETGNGCPHLCGWGNNESQYYLPQNAWVSDGILTIEARRENIEGFQYTSTRMKTQGKKSFRYGRIDIRALLPKGQGIWPALWMLGNDITSVGWPSCGEIDIMEMIGGSGRENQIHGTLHWNNQGHVHTGGSYTLPTGTFADEYHVFSIIWDQTSIKWLVNDIPYHEINITPSHMTEFHQEFFFIFNVAVGGNWPGYPDGTTVFPQQMKVDYIRVFQ